MPGSNFGIWCQGRDDDGSPPLDPAASATPSPDMASSLVLALPAAEKKMPRTLSYENNPNASCGSPWAPLPMRMCPSILMKNLVSPNQRPCLLHLVWLLNAPPSHHCGGLIRRAEAVGAQNGRCNGDS
jgi:hypothetical protein